MVRINNPGPVKKAPKPIHVQHPPYFAEKRDLIRLKGIEGNLSNIQKYGDEIRKLGSRYIVLKVVEIVIAMDFDKQFRDAAREALSPITTYHKSIRPFDQFADTSIEPHPFFLGALFELLPEATAFRTFQIEFLEADKYLKAGRSLLRFSSAKKAAEFIQALQKDTGTDLKKFLRLCQRDERFRNYLYRRYQMDEVLGLLQILIKELD